MSDGGDDLDVLFGDGDRPDVAGSGRPAEVSAPPGRVWPPPAGYEPPAVPAPPPPPAGPTTGCAWLDAGLPCRAEGGPCHVCRAKDAADSKVVDPWAPDPFSQLTARQSKFLAALLVSDSIEAACEKAGVPGRTARRWLNQPVFDSAVRRAMIDQIGYALCRLGRHIDAAVRVVVELLECDKPSIRLRAAQTILDSATRGLGMNMLQAEVKEMSAWIDAKLKKRGEQGQ